MIMISSAMATRDLGPLRRKFEARVALQLETRNLLLSYTEHG
jgi:hypothetical protein